jgi:hypothetical protein
MVLQLRLLALAVVAASALALAALLPNRHDRPAGVVASVRDAPHRLLAFTATRDGRIRTTVPGAPASWHRLSAQLALVEVDARPPVRSNPGFSSYPLYVLGYVRSDVTRVVLRAPGFDPWTVYERRDGAPGTFEPALGITYGYGTYADSSKRPHEARAGLVPAQPWQARLAFFGAHGRLASLRLRYATAGARLVVVR